MFGLAILVAMTLFASSAFGTDEISYRVPGDVVGVGVGADQGSRILADQSLMELGRKLLADPADWVRLQEINQVRDPRHVPPGTVLRIPVKLLRQRPQMTSVVSVTGDAEADGRRLRPGMMLAQGSSLTTGAHGYISLRLPDGSRLDLPARSALRLDAVHGYAGVDGAEVRLKLRHGRMATHVQHQHGTASRFRVETPTAVIGVRGTAFRVSADPDKGVARAEITRGRVAVSTTHEAGPHQQRPLDAGFGMVATRGAGLSDPVRLLPAPSIAALPARYHTPLLQIPLPTLAGARAWRLQVARDASYAPVVVDRRVPAGTRTVRISGLADGAYRLTIRAIDARGLEGWDAVHPFRVDAHPEPPFLLLPATVAHPGKGPVQFRWAKVPDAIHYHLQVSAHADFKKPLIDADGLAKPGYQGALAGGRYFWRVAGVGRDGRPGPWSTPARFSVKPGAAAPAADGRTLHFAWAGGAGQRYEYQIADGRSFAAPVRHGIVAQPRVRLPRPRSGTYWIRVRALGADGYVGPWSDPQQIIVPAELPWWMLVAPLFAF